ncbi:MAG: DUF2726 domain-containing protein [Methylophilaceae bacterium]|nr:DUF2726 domain-containing protein [Methylophilaceae bacterium]
MTVTIALLFLGLIFLIVALFASVKGNWSSLLSASNLRPYVSKKPLTRTETIFYHRLVETLPEFIVLAQVQLSSFLKVDRVQTNNKNFSKWFNPISQQSIDFLICTKDFNIVAAVELDDKTHLKIKAKERDNKKNNNLEAAKVPLIRWHAEDMPKSEEIKQALLKYSLKDHNQISNANEWLADPQQTYFNLAKKQAKSLYITFIFGIFAIGIIIWGASEIIRTYLKVKSTSAQITQNIKIQTPVKPSDNSYREILEKQERERSSQDEIAKQNFAAKNQLIQQQQQKASQVSEESLKEEIWNRDYKKSTECSSTENMVSCGNKYIKARQKFKQYWESEKSKLK